MHEYAILFTYHRRNCPVTWDHFRRLCQLHPGVPIVPLSTGQAMDLPNTTDVSQYPCRWDTSDAWAAPDTMIYRWFENGKVTAAKRYINFEWDILTEVHLPDLLRPVWDAPLACMRFLRDGVNKGWYWFCERDQLPADLRPFAAGCVPFGFLLLQHHALAQLTAAARPAKVNAELRLGTVARSLGIEVAEMPWLRPTVRHAAHLIRKVDYPTIYHPVKELGQIGGPAPSSE
jgi:hypothetical protein